MFGSFNAQTSHFTWAGVNVQCRREDSEFKIQNSNSKS